MKNFSERKRKRNPWANRAILAGLLLVTVFLFRAVWQVYEKATVATQERKNVETELASLQDRQKFLESKVAELKTPSGVEREIREKFNVKKPGEEVAIIVGSATATPENDDQNSFIGGFLRFLHGIF